VICNICRLEIVQGNLGLARTNKKKNVTLHLNSEVYEAYSDYCKKEGIVKELEKNGTLKK